LLALANGICADERGVALARAEPPASNARTALVVGNGAYATGRLDNPANDAAAMARALRGLGFDVIEKTDVDRRGFLGALKAFKQRLQRRGGAALFFYAGHGVQLNGRNFLIPIGADINGEADVEFEAVDANRVLRYMDEAETRLNVVILDACRDNPYARSFRSARRGLATMQMPLGELGSLLAYSTAPGEVAADGVGRNSPFTKHLLAIIDTPGLRLYDVFQRVRIAVYEETGHRQMPWVSEALLGDFYFIAPPAPPPRTSPSSPSVPRRPTVSPLPAAVVPLSENDPSAVEAALALTDTERRAVQRALNGLGFDAGAADGVLGPRTRQALAAYQRAEGLRATGYLSGGQPERLAAALAERATARPAEPEVGETWKTLGRALLTEVGETWTEPLTGIELAWVPGGCFQMGSDEGDTDERPVHEVCVEGFWLGTTEVTQGQWRRVMGDNPSAFENGDDYPVESVSWDDARAFVTKLNGRGAGGLRLPSEAEWEYACRDGGRAQTYCGGEDLDRLAWYRENGGSKTHPVGGKQANALGLYDMSGNVWEWVADCYAESYAGAPTDGSAREAADCARRVIRGGSWNDDPRDLRAANRYRPTPGSQGSHLGFRLARTP
jgi:formylglycine-generating enzyme required for sulfatase activity